jgi:hypothetical protein
VRYTKVVSTHDGGSRFENVDVEMKTALAANGVPSLLLSAPVPVTSLAFLQQADGVGEWPLHPAPRRQFTIVLSGRAAIQTSDGVRREFGPGDVVLVVRRPIPHWSTWDRAVRFVASPHGPGV